MLFPHEILINIFAVQTDIPSLLQSRLVCHLWDALQVGNDASIWKQRVQYLLPPSSPLKCNESKGGKTAKEENEHVYLNSGPNLGESEVSQGRPVRSDGSKAERHGDERLSPAGRWKALYRRWDAYARRLRVMVGQATSEELDAALVKRGNRWWEYEGGHLDNPGLGDDRATVGEIRQSNLQSIQGGRAERVHGMVPAAPPNPDLSCTSGCTAVRSSMTQGSLEKHTDPNRRDLVGAWVEYGSVPTFLSTVTVGGRLYLRSPQTGEVVHMDLLESKPTCSSRAASPTPSSSALTSTEKAQRGEKENLSDDISEIHPVLESASLAMVNRQLDGAVDVQKDGDLDEIDEISVDIVAGTPNDQSFNRNTFNNQNPSVHRTNITDSSDPLSCPDYVCLSEYHWNAYNGLPRPYNAIRSATTGELVVRFPPVFEAHRTGLWGNIVVGLVPPDIIRAFDIHDIRTHSEHREVNGTTSAAAATAESSMEPTAECIWEAKVPFPGHVDFATSFLTICSDCIVTHLIDDTNTIQRVAIFDPRNGALLGQINESDWNVFDENDQASIFRPGGVFAGSSGWGPGLGHLQRPYIPYACSLYPVAHVTPFHIVLFVGFSCGQNQLSKVVVFDRRTMERVGIYPLPWTKGLRNVYPWTLKGQHCTSGDGFTQVFSVCVGGERDWWGLVALDLWSGQETVWELGRRGIGHDSRVWIMYQDVETSGLRTDGVEKRHLSLVWRTLPIS
ncbi:hypothetical protein HK102_006562 [Quaeritorhiza haematococci]|nr:hypothetical protein HK102_006562 [Quaeritorhiza haematococci]